MNIEATHLGKRSDYPKQYTPDILVAVPRKLNREQYNIKDNSLPFSGVDVWHAYEFSFLLKNGLPIAGMLKIVYTAESECLVESKSLKLYLNSFNMSRFGKTKEIGIEETIYTIKSDLCSLLNCDVEVEFIDHTIATNTNDFKEYPVLEDSIETNNLQLNHFIENPELLKTDLESSFKWCTHLLRSNCKITHQPDWGSLFIAMEGNRTPTPESFMEYIVSLRNENHFHEEICEMVFKRIFDRFCPNKLTVTCTYTRRGGIDINPIRTLNKSSYPKQLANCKVYTQPVFRQ